MLAPSQPHLHKRSSLSSFDNIKSQQAAASLPRARISRSARAGDQPPVHVLPLHPLAFAPPPGPRARAHTSARLVPSSWNPVFLDKPKAYIRHLIRQPQVYPVCSLHLAAICIQRWWRALGRLQRTKRSRRRLQTLPTWRHPWEELKTVAAQGSWTGPGRAAVQGGGSGTTTTVVQWMGQGGTTVTFADYCASVIQRAWRHSRERRRRLYVKRRMYRVAARSVQEWWRTQLWRREQRKLDQQWAAVVIQRAFRRHAVRHSRTPALTPRVTSAGDLSRPFHSPLCCVVPLSVCR